MPTISETIGKVREFAELQPGWYFGDGIPVSPDGQHRAIAILRFAESFGLERANAFPGSRGEVELTFYRGEAMLELTCEADNSFTIAQDEGQVQVAFRENASFSDAVAALKDFSESENIWLTSDLFIGSITIRSERTSVVGHLISPLVSQYQSWIRDVPWKQAEQFVIIFPRTTVSKLAFPPFTGQFLTRLFPQAVDLNNKRPTATFATTISTVGAGSEFENCLSLLA
jgi:hypothetical protein